MHEMSLVQGLLHQLDTIALENNASKVLQVTMSIGPLSGVVIDSFRFGFEILAKESQLVRDAKLEIIIPAVTYRCSNCHHEEEITGDRPAGCSRCDDSLLIAHGGDDLILQQVEME